jgi:hypothetical protein
MPGRVVVAEAGTGWFGGKTSSRVEDGKRDVVRRKVFAGPREERQGMRATDRAAPGVGGGEEEIGPMGGGTGIQQQLLVLAAVVVDADTLRAQKEEEEVQGGAMRDGGGLAGLGAGHSYQGSRGWGFSAVARARSQPGMTGLATWAHTCHPPPTWFRLSKPRKAFVCDGVKSPRLRFQVPVSLFTVCSRPREPL